MSTQFVSPIVPVAPDAPSPAKRTAPKRKTSTRIETSNGTNINTAILNNVTSPFMIATGVSHSTKSSGFSPTQIQPTSPSKPKSDGLPSPDKTSPIKIGASSPIKGGSSFFPLVCRVNEKSVSFQENVIKSNDELSDPKESRENAKATTQGTKQESDGPSGTKKDDGPSSPTKNSISSLTSPGFSSSATFLAIVNADMTRLNNAVSDNNSERLFQADAKKRSPSRLHEALLQRCTDNLLKHTASKMELAQKVSHLELLIMLIGQFWQRKLTNFLSRPSLQSNTIKADLKPQPLSETTTSADTRVTWLEQVPVWEKALSVLEMEVMKNTGSGIGTSNIEKPADEKKEHTTFKKDTSIQTPSSINVLDQTIWNENESMKIELSKAWKKTQDLEVEVQGLTVEIKSMKEKLRNAEEAVKAADATKAAESTKAADSGKERSSETEKATAETPGVSESKTTKTSKPEKGKRIDTRIWTDQAVETNAPSKEHVKFQTEDNDNEKTGTARSISTSVEFVVRNDTEIVKLKERIAFQEAEIASKNAEIDSKTIELSAQNIFVKQRDADIAKLQEELDKLRSENVIETNEESDVNQVCDKSPDDGSQAVKEAVRVVQDDDGQDGKKCGPTSATNKGGTDGVSPKKTPDGPNTSKIWTGYSNENEKKQEEDSKFSWAQLNAQIFSRFMPGLSTATVTRTTKPDKGGSDNKSFSVGGIVPNPDSKEGSDSKSSTQKSHTKVGEKPEVGLDIVGRLKKSLELEKEMGKAVLERNRALERDVTDLAAVKRKKEEEISNLRQEMEKHRKNWNSTFLQHSWQPYKDRDENGDIRHHTDGSTNLGENSTSYSHKAIQVNSKELPDSDSSDKSRKIQFIPVHVGVQTSGFWSLRKDPVFQ